MKQSTFESVARYLKFFEECRAQHPPPDSRYAWLVATIQESIHQLPRIAAQEKNELQELVKDIELFNRPAWKD